MSPLLTRDVHVLTRKSFVGAATLTFFDQVCAGLPSDLVCVCFVYFSRSAATRQMEPPPIGLQHCAHGRDNAMIGRRLGPVCRMRRFRRMGPAPFCPRCALAQLQARDANIHIDAASAAPCMATPKCLTRGLQLPSQVQRGPRCCQDKSNFGPAVARRASCMLFPLTVALQLVGITEHAPLKQGRLHHMG